MTVTNFSGIIEWARVKNLPEIYALCLFSQAQHETGRFTSNLFLNANNAFGMKVANTRPQQRSGVFELPEGNFAMYADVESSYNDRIALDDYARRVMPTQLTDVREYCSSVVNSGYALDPTYLGKWLAFINENLRQYNSSMSLPTSTVHQLENGEGVGSVGMTFFGISQKMIITIIGAIAGYFGFKFIKKRFL